MAEEQPIRAEDLVAAMEEAGGDVLDFLGQQLKAMVIADLPVGDPSLDPDPAFSLRDHVVVRRYGNTVSVAVEGPYAIKQHEAQQFGHPRGGRAKYLERNTTALIRVMQDRLQGEVARSFSKPIRRGRRSSTGFTTQL